MLLSVARQTGENPKELIELTADPCPELLEHVYAMFWEVSASRGGNGYGPNPISYCEMQAWAQLTGQTPTPFEVGIVKELDALFMAQHAKAAKTKG